VILSIAPGDATIVEKLFAGRGLEFAVVGKVIADPRLKIGGAIDEDVAGLQRIYEDAIQGGSQAVTEEDSVLAIEAVEESPLDVFHEECACSRVPASRAANLAYLGLYAQQHRGQESAGIVSSNGKSLISHRGMGLVADISILRSCGARRHQRDRAQPLLDDRIHDDRQLPAAGGRVCAGGLALAHNGNLVNFNELRERLESTGSIFQSSSDSEVMIHLIAASRAPTLPERVAEALSQVRGAYSLVVLTKIR